MRCAMKKLHLIVAQAIIRFMEKRQLNQTTLGKKAGLDQPTISRIISGKYGNPQLATLVRIADALEVQTYELLMPANDWYEIADALKTQNLRTEIKDMEKLITQSLGKVASREITESMARVKEIATLANEQLKGKPKKS